MGHKPKLEQYRNAAFLQYMQNVLNFTSAEQAVEKNMELPYKSLQKAVEQFKDSFLPLQKHELTPIIENLDFQRDQLFRGIGLQIESYTYHYDVLLQKHAEILSQHSEKYGKNITRMAYQQETAVLDNLIQDWNTERESVEALGLTQWIMKLQQINQQFDSNYIKRTESLAQREESQTKTLRPAITQLYRDWIAYMQAHRLLSKDSFYEELLQKISTLAKQYNETMRSGSTTSEDSNEQSV